LLIAIEIVAKNKIYLQTKCSNSESTILKFLNQSPTTHIKD